VRISSEDAPAIAGRATDIFLVGLGMHIGHMTRDADVVMQACKTCYFMHNDPEVRHYIKQLPGKAVDIFDFYTENVSRMITYRQIAATVLDSARSSRPVCIALYGHPMFLSTISQMVLYGADWLGLRTAVIPGISSFDTVSSDLRIDPGQVSLQIQEATSMLLFRTALDPHRGLIVLQPAQFGTVLQSSARSRAARFAPLLQYLLQFYPVGHPIYLVASSQTSRGQPQIDRALLGLDLDLSQHLRQETTVYLPPLSAVIDEDADMRKTLYEKSWLDQVVGGDGDDAQSL
jgi:uncharacterized protein YabN with tetrapyrrole methylase and pyrophosphatase domain